MKSMQVRAGAGWINIFYISLSLSLSLCPTLSLLNTHKTFTHIASLSFSGLTIWQCQRLSSFRAMARKLIQSDYAWPGWGGITPRTALCLGCVVGVVVLTERLTGCRACGYILVRSRIINNGCRSSPTNGEHWQIRPVSRSYLQAGRGGESHYFCRQPRENLHTSADTKNIFY